MTNKRNPGRARQRTGASQVCLGGQPEATAPCPLWQRRSAVTEAVAMREACIRAGNSGAVQWRDHDWRFLACVGAQYAPSPIERVRLRGLYQSLERAKEVRRAA